MFREGFLGKQHSTALYRSWVGFQALDRTSICFKMHSWTSEVSSRNTSILQESCRTAMSALRMLGTRNLVIIIDETVWSPMWEVMVALRPDAANMSYIGGYIERSRDEDYSCVGAGATELDDTKLSKMRNHFGLTRADCHKHFYCVDMLPRGPRPKEQTATEAVLARAPETLEEVGVLMQAATAVNGGLPPIGVAADGGGANSHVNACLLGLLPSEWMDRTTFFSQCTKNKKLNLPLWTYQPLFFQEHFLSGSNDSRHVMKRYGAHLVSGTRVVRFGGFLVQLTPLVTNGLSVRALAVENLQSDSDSSKRLNSGYLPDNWASYGCLIAQFVASLISSAWSGCSGFTMRESVSNALLGYYVLLCQCSQTHKQFAKQWTKHFLPIQTIRTLLDLVGHIVQAARFWENNIAWRPSQREEYRIEGFFGEVKSYTQGSPTLKDGLYGTYMVHAKQYQKSALVEKEIEKANFQREIPLTDEELTKIAAQAFSDACDFQAWISPDISSQQVRDTVETWWSQFGKDLVRKRFSKGEGAAEEEAEMFET